MMMIGSVVRLLPIIKEQDGTADDDDASSHRPQNVVGDQLKLMQFHLVILSYLGIYSQIKIIIGTFLSSSYNLLL